LLGVPYILSWLLGLPNVLGRTCVRVTYFTLTFGSECATLPCPERMFVQANTCSFWWCDKSHIEKT